MRRQAGHSSSEEPSSHRVTFMEFQQTGQVIQRVSPKPLRSLHLRVLSLCIVYYFRAGRGRNANQAPLGRAYVPKEPRPFRVMSTKKL